MDQSPAQPAATAAVPEMAGEDAHAMGEESDLQASAGFDGALRGYDRRQVNKYVQRTQKRFEELTAELTTARRNEQILSARVDELTKQVAMCSCDPNKPESSVVGARLRQIIDIASSEAADLRQRAESETIAMREEAENLLAGARQQAEQASSALEAMLAHRRAAEEAAAAERRAAIEGWAERHVNEARDTARRVIERAGAVSSQVIASARWLVDALGAHRDALSEQLGGVQRRIDELPSLEAAAAIPGEKLAGVSTEDRSNRNGSGVPATRPAGQSAPAQPVSPGRTDEAEQAVRAVVRVAGPAGPPLANEAPVGERHDGPLWGADPRSASGSAPRHPAHAMPQAPGGAPTQGPGGSPMPGPGGGAVHGSGGAPAQAPGGAPTPPHNGAPGQAPGGMPMPAQGGMPMPAPGGVPMPAPMQGPGGSPMPGPGGGAVHGSGGAPAPAPVSAPRHAAPPDTPPFNRTWTPVANPGSGTGGLHRG
ncbi:hypothetical protein HC031_20940 [Planosporangium thailandense]|uniref:DivIVA protein n=1 Tax=Planosporangium thailandense TaxID=765197 RepID=A0ABX0Y1C5_9ACTN|nr:hypothetical protein [Planosporangium thailandense]NJC72164.1 hypothetical protein [Planosporangium thailandense]